VGKMPELLDTLAMHDDVERIRQKRMVYGGHPLTGWFCFKDAVFLELAQWYRWSNSYIKVRCIWTRPECRGNGLASELLEILKGICDGLGDCQLVLTPVPFRFLRPIEDVDFGRVGKADLEDGSCEELDDYDGPSWRELERWYIRREFVKCPECSEEYVIANNPNGCVRRVHLTSYSQREGREALIYESKEKTECIRA